MTKKLIMIGVILLCSYQNSPAQMSRNSSLFLELKKQDSVFFERGFNRCDLEYLEKTVADDLRFYHDKGGYQDKSVFMDNTKKNICSAGNRKPIRKVDEQSLTVYPLYNDGKLYGAIQSGIHYFYIREAGKADVWTNTARFTSVWILDGAVWKLRDVLSYDHQDPREDSGTAMTVEKMLEANHVPAMGLAIIEGGKVTTTKVYGTLDHETKAPANTIFKVASLTKPVVAVTTLRLIQKGLLGLDEPLYKYWIDPDLKGDKRLMKLTPRIVLSHQTGFPNWRYLNDSKKLSFEFEPGTRHQYSGEGFEYLRKAIEAKLGRKIEELARDYLFEPAGMTDTHFWWDKSVDEDRYAKNFDSGGNIIPTARYYEANAAANLLTTVEDYSKFLTYVLDGAGLSEGLLNQMHKNQVSTGNSSYFGLGWEKLMNFSTGEYALLHTGRDPGVSTLAVIFPKSKNGYLIFLNGDNSMKVYEGMLSEHLYLGKELWGKK